MKRKGLLLREARKRRNSTVEGIEENELINEVGIEQKWEGVDEGENREEGRDTGKGKGEK